MSSTISKRPSVGQPMPNPAQTLTSPEPDFAGADLKELLLRAGIGGLGGGMQGGVGGALGAVLQQLLMQKLAPGAAGGGLTKRAPPRSPDMMGDVLPGDPRA